MRPCRRRPTSSAPGPPISDWRAAGSAPRRWTSCWPAVHAPPRRSPRPPRPPWPSRRSSTSAACCTAETARSRAPRSCAPRRNRRAASPSAPSSKKSATSLPSPSSPVPVRLGRNRASASRWAWVVGLGITLGLLAWAMHGVSARDLVDGVRRANRGLMLATVALATLTFPIRTLRWRLILRDVGGGAYPLRPLWHATAIGFMANNLLPVRAGEFARAYVASRQLPVRFSTALASVGVERVFDGLMLVSLMAVAIGSSAFPHRADIGRTSVSAITTTAAAFFGVVLVVAVLVVHRPAPWLALLGRATHALLPARVAARVMRIADWRVAGLEVLKNPGRFAAVVFWADRNSV